VRVLTGREAEEPPAWQGVEGLIRAVSGGLEACARLRDARPALQWLPRLEVHRPEVVYRMSDYPGEGFKFYAPDTSAVRGYRVADGNQRLQDALERARTLGFEQLWLHAREAATRGRGLDLELLERARRGFGDGLWISGGATEPVHLENLAREGGATAVVVEANVFFHADAGALLTALASPRPPAEPVHFVPRAGEREKNG
jgi:hypothetical protein